MAYVNKDYQYLKKLKDQKKLHKLNNQNKNKLKKLEENRIKYKIIQTLCLGLINKHCIYSSPCITRRQDQCITCNTTNLIHQLIFQDKYVKLCKECNDEIKQYIQIIKYNLIKSLFYIKHLCYHILVQDLYLIIITNYIKVIKWHNIKQLNKIKFLEPASDCILSFKYLKNIIIIN